MANNNSGKERPPKSDGNKAYEFNSYSSTMSYQNLCGDLNLLDFYSPQDISAIINNPMGRNKELRDISRMLYGSNGVYTHTVDFITAMPTLSKVITVHGQSEQKKSKNKQLMESTLRTIKDKEFVRDALFKGMIEGVAFYYFETVQRPYSNKKYMTDYDVDSIVEINELGLNVSIISLPVDYTRIVGIRNNSYVLAFNLEFFDIAGAEDTEKKLRKYPKEIRDAYNSWKKKTGNNGNWFILDNNKTIVHKIRSKRDEPWGRVLCLAAIQDILYSDLFLLSKRNALNDLNNRIIYQTFPEGATKGLSSLSKKQQEDQHEKVKGAVQAKNSVGGISFFSVAAGTKIDVIEAANTDILEDTYESTLSDDIALDLGIAGSLLNGSGSGSYSAQQNNLELLTSVVFQWVSQIEVELNKVISANIIKDSKNWVEVRYLPITHVNRSSMVGYCKDLYLQGCGPLSLWAAATGVEPEVFFSLIDEEIDSGLYEKLVPHQTSYTYSASDSDNSPGRPETDDPSENTVKSWANNGNALPTPSDNK